MNFDSSKSTKLALTFNGWLLKSENNINLHKKFNSQLNLTKIFAKFWRGSPVEPELGTAQPQLVLFFSFCYSEFHKTNLDGVQYGHSHHGIII